MTCWSPFDNAFDSRTPTDTGLRCEREPGDLNSHPMRPRSICTSIGCNGTTRSFAPLLLRTWSTGGSASRWQSSAARQAISLRLRPARAPSISINCTSRSAAENAAAIASIGAGFGIGRGCGPEPS